MIYSLYISFSSYNLATNSSRPIGFDNYARLFEDPRVAVSLANTLFYAVMAVPLEIMFALVLALLLNRMGRGAGIFRTLYYLPKMTPAVATAAVFFLLLNGNSGAINQGLAAIGIQGPQWLVDPAWVKPSIVIMALWTVSGTMVIFLAALKNVPVELYEVASLDGGDGGPPRRQDRRGSARGRTGCRHAGLRERHSGALRSTQTAPDKYRRIASRSASNGVSHA